MCNEFARWLGKPYVCNEFTFLFGTQYFMKRHSCFWGQLFCSLPPLSALDHRSSVLPSGTYVCQCHWRVGIVPLIHHTAATTSQVLYLVVMKDKPLASSHSEMSDSTPVGRRPNLSSHRRSSSVITLPVTDPRDGVLIGSLLHRPSAQMLTACWPL